MKAVDASFLGLLGSSQTQFVIPVYQRVYSWGERECAELWDDLMRAGRQGAQHFIGSFLYTPQEDSTAIDLIRNYILMSLPANAQSKLYEGYWRPIEKTFGQEHDDEFNAFVWYWLWLKVPMRKPREDEAYDEFKRYCQDQNLTADPEPLLRELLDYARLYARMFLGREDDPSLAAHFKRIAELGVKPIRPLMLELYRICSTDPKRLPKDAFERLLTHIESFLFRRSVTGRFSTGLNNFFAGMYHPLEKAEDPEEYVTAMLLVHGQGQTAYFPTDDDPKRLCQNKEFGPGLPTRVDLTSAGQLPDVLDLLAQC